MGVDRILDMCRTSVNVTGDIAASLVLNRWLPEEDRSTQAATALAGRPSPGEAEQPARK